MHIARQIETATGVRKNYGVLGEIPRGIRKDVSIIEHVREVH